MKMSLVTENRFTALCLLFNSGSVLCSYLSQILFPLWLDFSEIDGSYFRISPNPSRTLSSRELTIRESHFWIQETCGVFLWYKKGAESCCEAPPQKECQEQQILQMPDLTESLGGHMTTVRNRKFLDCMSFGCHRRFRCSQFFAPAPPWPWACGEGAGIILLRVLFLPLWVLAWTQVPD